MNCIIITILLITILILSALCIHDIKGKGNENFQYATLNIPSRRRTFYNKQKSKINPGFGNKMWELESAPNCSGIIDPSNPQPGDLGRYVSCAQDRNNATSIKNLSV